MLTEQQLRQFQAGGCTIVPALFSGQEVLAMQAKLQRFRRKGLGKNVATDDEAEHGVRVVDTWQAEVEKLL